LIFATLLPWRARFMAEAPTILIAATSARALTASARRAGYAPLAIDFFADEDTRRDADRCERVSGRLAEGFDLEELMAAGERLADGRSITGFVYGAGFEDRPALIAAAAQRWRLFGNPASVVSRVKDPVAFAECCRANAIPHPEIALEPPTDASFWLARRRGGSGGGHISECENTAADSRTYFQRRVAGQPISALAVSDGARCSILGFSEQWSVREGPQPFRFAGAARLAVLEGSLARALTQAVERMSEAVPLIGLNSFDFLVDGGKFWLLEVNPRPGATLDLFESESDTQSLFALHVAACSGRLSAPPRQDGCRAVEILYADFDIVSTPALDWPDWAVDRQTAGTYVAKGEPFCSIVAEGATTVEARRNLQDKAAFIRSSLRMKVA
jgi:predicted ATP-grasp superfamily ATP-dependent carboligase